MNIETVNELIRSLESAGELSIREQKFLKLAKAFKQVAAENKRLTDVAQGGAFVMQKALMEYEFGAGMTMQANCCGGIALDIYDAMIAAAPHDTPALNSLQSVDSVTGGWIPVSDRMPEDRTQVILWDAEIGEVTSGHYSHKTHTFYHCGDAIENEITHWMAPPAAPQEVK